jgi:hypothetical protein
MLVVVRPDRVQCPDVPRLDRTGRDDRGDPGRQTLELVPQSVVGELPPIDVVVVVLGTPTSRGLVRRIFRVVLVFLEGGRGRRGCHRLRCTLSEFLYADGKWFSRTWFVNECYDRLMVSESISPWFIFLSFRPHLSFQHAHQNLSISTPNQGQLLRTIKSNRSSAKCQTQTIMKTPVKGRNRPRFFCPRTRVGHWALSQPATKHTNGWGH